MKNLLLVEDDAAIREMMRRRLAMRGFDVQVAAHGAEALAIAFANPPEAVLLDVQMPGGMSGWDVASALRGVPCTAGVRIFLVTAHVTPGDVERARRAGCARIFGKPVDFRALLEALRGETGREASR